MYAIENSAVANHVLCIKADQLERKNEVQKKIQLEKAMESCVYCSPDRLKEGYVPLTLGATIRDLKTNKVLVKRDEETNVKRTFVYLTKVQPVPHVGYDLVMYLASIGATSIVKEGVSMLGFSQVMANSAFDVSGLVWLERNTEKDCILLDPMIMTTIYVDYQSFETYVSDKWKFEEIADIKKEDGFIQCLLDDLVEIKIGG